jgi:hypothetical protein
MFKRLDEHRGPTLILLTALALLAAAWRSDAVRPLLGGPVNAALDDVSNDWPNDADMDDLTRNYYEGLLELEREPTLGTGVAASIANWLTTREALPKDWRKAKEPMEYGPPDAFLFRENVPDYDGVYKGVHVHMNKWGQRDKEDYSKSKPPRTFRIAVSGGSNTMGFGVEWEDTFAERLERRFNAEFAGGAYDKYEVLNFASNGYHLLEKTYVAVVKCAEFEPDLILVDVLGTDMRSANCDQLATRVLEGRDLHFDFLKQLVEHSGARKGDNQARLRRRLRPYRRQIVSECVEALSVFQQERGITVCILSMRTSTRGLNDGLEWTAVRAEKLGVPVLRIFDSFEGGGQDLYVHPRDFHMSGKAHGLVADEIFAKMMNDDKLRALVTGRSAPESKGTP